MRLALLALAAAALAAAAGPGDADAELREACGRGAAQEVLELLGHGASPHSATADGERPLHLACIGGDAAIVSMLVEAGADPNARATGPSSLRMTALTWCAYAGHHEAIGVLIDAGAAVNLVVDREDGALLTALDIADSIGDRGERSAALLRKAGAKSAAAFGDAKAGKAR